MQDKARKENRMTAANLDQRDTPEENRRMFGSIPQQSIHAHDWRGGCVYLGQVPADYVEATTKGAALVADGLGSA